MKIENFDTLTEEFLQYANEKSELFEKFKQELEKNKNNQFKVTFQLAFYALKRSEVTEKQLVPILRFLKDYCIQNLEQQGYTNQEIASLRINDMLQDKEIDDHNKAIQDLYEKLDPID